MSTGTEKLVAALLGICVCAAATPEMYRWVDENGVTVYSQSPPPFGDAVKIKKQRAPGADDAGATGEQRENRRRQAREESEARSEAEAGRAQQAKGAQDEPQRAANCAAARANLQTLQNLGRRMIRTPDGRVLRLSEDQVQTQIEKSQMQIEELCN
jgi:hypothetical protein